MPEIYWLLFSCVSSLLARLQVRTVKAHVTRVFTFYKYDYYLVVGEEKG